MKKVLIIIILLLNLSSCNIKERNLNERKDLTAPITRKSGIGIYALQPDLKSPTINNVKDEMLPCQDKFYDAMTGIIVNDGTDGIIDNNKVTVIMVNLENDVIIEQINLNYNGKYRIEYEVKNSQGYLAKISKILTVGDGIINNNHNNVPYITGVGSYHTDLTKGKFKAMAGVYAYDIDGKELTNNVTYQITNLYTQAIIDEIDLSINGKYMIDYRVKGMNDLIGVLSRQVVVGNILASPISFAGLKGVGYVYDYNTINDYQLVFSDEFNNNGSPDATKFTYDIGNGNQGWGNWELEYYTNNTNNVKIENGKMVITARQEQYAGFNYTSSKVKTDGLFNFRYGIVEIKAKLPTGIGTWPALWMMPNGSGFGAWPLCGEIDIMEHVGYNQDKVIGTVHTGAFNGSNGLQKGGSIYCEKASETYHVYKLEWLPDVINWYLDDILYFSYSPADYSENPGTNIWPFDKEFFLIFNIAVGGLYGGMAGVDEDIWPQSMYIDYVRVYQSPTVLALHQLP